MLKPSLFLTLVFLASLCFAVQASAHVCEGSFTISNVRILRQKGDFEIAPGQINGSVCPKNLAVVLSHRPEGDILAGITADAGYSTPEGLIEDDLQSEESSRDLTNSVGNGMILATDVGSMGISGTLDANGGSSKMAHGIPFINRQTAFNSVQCDAAGLKLEFKYTDFANDDDLVCTYARQAR